MSNSSYTDFSKLNKALGRIGIADFVAETLGELKIGRKEGDTENTENIVLAERGIYLLEKRNDVFVLFKATLHITDIQKMWIEKKSVTAISDLNKKRYDSNELVEQLHRHHFTECTTIKHMFTTGRKKRYYNGNRKDGRFAYSVLDGDKVMNHRTDQKLFACRYCISQIGKTRKNFRMDDIFTTKVPFPVGEFELECDAVPNIYSPDWDAIAEKAKQQTEWTCQECAINLQNDTEYLHCHHINTMRSDNSVENLQVLCIKCHANQPNHQHMKKLPEYQEFIEQYYES